MHTHAHPGGSGAIARILRGSVVVTMLYVAATLIFGLRAHSLALISEAGHNVSDVLALGLSWVALHFQSRPADDRKTFGYGRAGVLAAFVNALTLIVLAVWITWLAIGRLLHPVPIASRTMMIVAAAGLVMNGIIAALLSRGKHDVNLRGAFLHMLSDTLSTGAVILGGAAIYFTGARWVDPALSIVIALLVLWSTIGIVRETMNILLEGAPLGIRIAEVRSAMQSVEGVEEVHDLHVWSVGSGAHALASHVTVGNVAMDESERILRELLSVLRNRFRILHATVQFEREGCPTGHGCAGLPLEEATTGGHHHHHHAGHAHSH